MTASDRMPRRPAAGGDRPRIPRRSASGCISRFGAVGAAAAVSALVDQAVILAAAAVIFNIRLLRDITRHRLHRPKERDQALPAGLVLYPTSVLLLLLMLPSRPDIVAAAWGILAAGDGAATLVGRRYGTHEVVLEPAEEHRGIGGVASSPAPRRRVPGLVVPRRRDSAAVLAGFRLAARLWRRWSRRPSKRPDPARRQPVRAVQRGRGRAVDALARQRGPADRRRRRGAADSRGRARR